MKSTSASINKKLVVNFFTLAFVDKRVEEAFNKYVGDTYIQHDSHFPDKKAQVTVRSGLFC